MKSQPSKPTFFFDVMDLVDLRGEFIYNFYETDEYVRKNITYPPSQKENLQKIPRYVRLMWTYQNSSIPTLNVGDLLLQNLTQINNEADVVSSNELKLQIQDAGINARIASTIVSKTILNSSPSDIKNYSNMQLIRSIIGDLDPALQQNYETHFASSQLNIQPEKFSINLSKEYAATIISNSIVDPLCPYTLELQNAQAAAAQARQFSDMRPQFGDYSPLLKSITVSPTIAASFTDADLTQLYHIGYRITRREKTLNNTTSTVLFHIPQHDVNSYIDFDITYGSTYSYSISPIFIFSYPDVLKGAKYFALIAATPSNPLELMAIDTTKPNPPLDIHYYWDYTNSNLFFCWSYPPDPKNRIAKVQIFRRKSIDQPYALIKEYDFDKTVRVDNPFIDIAKANAYEKTQEKVGLFVDQQFNINSKYIYALCLVDVHGNSSVLSAQFEITFDRFKSGIVQRLISRFGSLKEYPNMMLEADLFVDLLKDSNHSSLELYFNPEVRKIVFGTGQQNNKIDSAFLTNSSGNYKILTINTDLQKTSITTVQISEPTITQQAQQTLQRINNGLR